MAREIVIKWHENDGDGIERPRIYWFRNGKPTRQLRLADIEQLVLEKEITDEKVLEWLKRKQNTGKLDGRRNGGRGIVKDSDASPRPKVKLDADNKQICNDARQLKAGSAELYEHLEAMYKKTKWLNV